MLPRRSIAIGVISRFRPKLLAKLFDSLTRLDPLPANADIRIILVENHSERVIEYRQAVEAFREKIEEAGHAWEVVHELEPRRGIACARNRALDTAARLGCEFLACIDDDCHAWPEWLDALMRAQKAEDADLVSGTMGIKLDPGMVATLTRREKFFARALSDSHLRRYRKRVRRKEVAGCTANMLLRTAFVAEHGLRFDEELGLGFGEDLVFFEACARAGAKTAFVHHVVVSEIVTHDCLSATYIAERARTRALALNYINGKPYAQALLELVVGWLLLPCLPVLALVAGRAYWAETFVCEGRTAAAAQYLIGSKETDFFRYRTGY